MCIKLKRYFTNLLDFFDHYKCVFMYIAADKIQVVIKSIPTVSILFAKLTNSIFITSRIKSATPYLTNSPCQFFYCCKHTFACGLKLISVYLYDYLIGRRGASNKLLKHFKLGNIFEYMKNNITYLGRDG